MTTSVFVTGAAAGIGRATVQRLLEEGYRVGAYDVDVAGLGSLAEEHGAAVADGLLVTGRLDVTDADEWAARLAEFTASSGGALDVLINNAGILSSGPFEDIPLAKQRLMVDVNVGGVLNGCHTAHPYLVASGQAQVINLCSASAIYGQAELATYSATKFAVRGLTEALDLEWRAQGIRLTALWPLFVNTGMVDGMDIGSSRSLGVRLTAPDVADAILAAITAPRRRLPRGVHRAVGRQAKTMLAASDMAPGWVLRAVNARVASH
ncbi:SDR family oxidoreductase [Nocardioides humilatus]|uniref:SDR family oxidoreductase n=1 Tax=Nocardioides humilatus TaxID=2607660 RepID=A0A5B1L8J8_9ACTN|nr:SDR family oxidoreductase [Nocardioides humilatus]KAA1416905.1 SDR family oxidoreductase [Nocardioides humilatus]